MKSTLKDLELRGRELGLLVELIYGWDGHYRCFSALCGNACFIADSLEDVEYRLGLFATIGLAAREHFLLGIGVVANE